MPRKKGPKQSEETIRLCANIRSKKHPDVRCTLTATQGDFCARHYKNPTRFQEKVSIKSTISLHQLDAAAKLQRWWIQKRGMFRYRRQGPCVNSPDIAENQTDIYTLESTTSIPLLYRWSYWDERKHCWLFDIRSLSMTHAEDSRENLLNPYTREPLKDKWVQRFQERCSWLRERKYCLVHASDTTDMTPEQVWHQKILDVTMKYDMLGYHTCLSWFEELNLQQLRLFYTELWELWFYRLQLNPTVKSQVVPGWNSADSLLFKWTPQEVRQRLEKKWWQKVMLDCLNRLVSSASTKEYKVLGALYGITAFAIVSPHVREHYPWLVEMGDD